MKRKIGIGFGIVVLLILCLEIGMTYLDYYAYRMEWDTREIITVLDGCINEEETKAVVYDAFRSLSFVDVTSSKITRQYALRDMFHFVGYDVETIASLGMFMNRDNHTYHCVYVSTYGSTPSGFLLMEYDEKGEFLGSSRILPGNREEKDVKGFRLIGDKLYFVRQDVCQLWAYDLTSGESKQEAQYASWPFSQYTSVYVRDDLNALVALASGETLLFSVDGTSRQLYRQEFHLKDDTENNFLNGRAVNFQNQTYVVNKYKINEIVRIDNGEFTTAFSTDQMYGEQVKLPENLTDYQIYSLNTNGGNMVFGVNNDLIYTTDGSQYQMIEGDNLSYETGLAIVMWWRRNSLWCYAVAAVLLLFFLCGVAMHWKITMRGRMMLSIIPPVLLIVGFLEWYTLSTIYENYQDLARTEYAFLGHVVAQGIDGELLESMDTYDDLVGEKGQKLADYISGCMVKAANLPTYYSLSIYAMPKDGIARRLVWSSVEERHFQAFRYIDENLLRDSEINHSGIYEVERSTAGYSLITLLVELKNQQGERIGYAEVYGGLNAAKDTIKGAILISVLFGVLLFFALFFILVVITKRLSRNIYKTREAVEKIAEGDFSARISKIPNDEMGVIANGVNEMAARIQRMFEDEREFSMDVIKTLVGTIDAKDKYTNGHSIRVAEYSRDIAGKLGMNESEVSHVYIAGLLHDIGKIGVPDNIINKTSRLDDDEFAVIKTHPEIGYHLLDMLKKMEDISVGAYYHHERYDGKGYPQGLKGEEIPYLARIIAVADAYDAMTSNRSYRKALSQDIVRGEIEKGKGKQFDPQMADAMLEVDLVVAEKVYGVNDDENNSI